MRRIGYKCIRNAPKFLATLGTFIASTWAAVDADTFKKYARWKLDHLDVGKTGTVIAASLALYFVILWLTRDWNRTDRDYYRENLLIIYGNISKLLNAVFVCDRDAHIAIYESDYHNTLKLAEDWIRPNMGDAAFAKFEAAHSPGLTYDWPGEHSLASLNTRNLLIDHLKGHQKNLDQLMQVDTWDHPISVSARKWQTRRIIWRIKTKKAKLIFGIFLKKWLRPRGLGNH